MWTSVSSESHLLAIDRNIFYLVSGYVLVKRDRLHVMLYVMGLLALLTGVNELIHREPDGDHDHGAGRDEPEHLERAHLDSLVAQLVFGKNVLIDERVVIAVGDFEVRLENVLARIKFI